jgi:hypothetical protein
MNQYKPRRYFKHKSTGRLLTAMKLYVSPEVCTMIENQSNALGYDGYSQYVSLLIEKEEDRLAMIKNQ